MGDAGVIRDASESVAEMLEGSIEGGTIEVTLSSPDTVTPGQTPTVGLFLYRVSETAEGNAASRVERDPSTVVPAPLTLDLHYLLTAYPSGGADDAKARTQHELLGGAVAAMRANAVLRGSALKGSLADDLHISRSNADSEVLTLWSTFPDTAYLPSVPYVVGPVAIESTAEEAARRVETFVREETDGDV